MCELWHDLREIVWLMGSVRYGDGDGAEDVMIKQGLDGLHIHTQKQNKTKEEDKMNGGWGWW